MSALEFLNSRLSVPSRQLGEPAPSAEQLDRLLAAALRVPDHGKLMPTRLLLIRGETRAKLGTALAAIHRRIEPGVPEAALEKDRERYNFAPLIVCVVARVDEQHAKVPAQEQILSAGCVAYNLLLGAQALGYGAQWLTGWAAYARDAAALLGLAANERVIGFVHIGTAREPAREGPRPDLAKTVGELKL
ncbi:MAG: nitroreductase [Proteobacteria bacterium]|nr:nitroreductase [Pseudomonadota bacterium]